MGSIGVLELIVMFSLIVGIPIAFIVLLLKRRNTEASNTVSMSELQEATSQTLQDSLTPLENKIDALTERIDALESRQSE